MYEVKEYAKKSFLALKNPFHTVMHVNPCIIDEVEKAIKIHGYALYTGIKDTEVISNEVKRQLSDNGCLLHTIDKMAYGGRAVDITVVNPLTGKWMTGSSSGTALNVFYGINDVGIGTDGGGSVLAPAASLNLFGFISPLIDEDEMKKYRKQSTDGIAFHPSIGIITKEADLLKIVVEVLIPKMKDSKAASNYTILKYDKENGPDLFGPREYLINYVNTVVKPGTLLLSEEGPVDLYGMGDSIFGHWDEDTQKMQRLSGKGLMRVVNMCGKTAAVIPQKELGRCLLVICESRWEDICQLFEFMKEQKTKKSKLSDLYFNNKKMYF